MTRPWRTTESITIRTHHNLSDPHPLHPSSSAPSDSWSTGAPGTSSRPSAGRPDLARGRALEAGRCDAVTEIQEHLHFEEHPASADVSQATGSRRAELVG